MQKRLLFFWGGGCQAASELSQAAATAGWELLDLESCSWGQGSVGCKLALPHLWLLVLLPCASEETSGQLSDERTAQHVAELPAAFQARRPFPLQRKRPRKFVRGDFNRPRRA